MQFIKKVKEFYWQNRKLMLEVSQAVDEIAYMKKFLTKEHPLLNKYSEDVLGEEHFIAHALGIVDAIDYTNSKEAFEASYSCGVRLFETDVSLTSDKIPVMCHEWGPYNKGALIDWGYYVKHFSSYDSKPPTYEYFMSNKILGKYTPLSLNNLVQIAKEHPDAKFIISVKSTNWEYNNEAMIAIVSLYEMIKENENCLNQFIPQAHSIEYAKYLMCDCRFKHIAFGFRDGKVTMEDLHQLVEIYGIRLFIMHKKYVNSNMAAYLRGCGCKIIYHTVNNIKDYSLIEQYDTPYVITDSLYIRSENDKTNC